MAKKIIIIAIILSLVLPAFVQTAQALVLDTSVSFGSCAAAGYLSNLISDQLSGLITQLENWVKDTFTKRIIGVTGLSGKVPVYDETLTKAVTGFKGAYLTKESVKDLIARCTAREILVKMGKDITNVARTGGKDGGPAYVRNWRNYETDAQYRGEEIFRNIMASTRLCDYFANETKSIFGVQAKKNLGRTNTRVNSFDPYQLSAGCTMPSNFNLSNFKNDFEGNGGWDAFSRLMEPQNNFYGVLIKSLSEAQKQRDVESRADLNEAVGNGGYTSIRGKSAADSCLVKGANGRCIVYKDIKTPGSTIGGSVVEGIAAELQWVASSDELNEVMASAIQVLVNRLLDLSNPNEGDYIVPGEPTVSIVPIEVPNNCAVITIEEGASARYEGDLDTAIGEYLAAHPEIANASADDGPDLNTFMDGVGAILSGKGFAAGRVINCNGNLSSDAVYVGRPSDLFGDYYDIRNGQIASEGGTIAQAVHSNFVEWAASSRLVGGGGPPEPTPDVPLP